MKNSSTGAKDNDMICLAYYTIYSTVCVCVCVCVNELDRRGNTLFDGRVSYHKRKEEYKEKESKKKVVDVSTDIQLDNKHSRIPKTEAAQLHSRLLSPVHTYMKEVAKTCAHNPHPPHPTAK